MATKHLKSLVLYTGLIGGMLISMFPFYWLIVMSTRTTSDIYKFPPQLWFGGELWNNITRVLQQIDFWGAFLNTLFVSGLVTILVLFLTHWRGLRLRSLNFPAKSGSSSCCSPP